MGDQVLTQSTRTGALGFKPILVVHRPARTFQIKLDGDDRQQLLPSVLESRARLGDGPRLEVGDAIRTLAGTEQGHRRRRSARLYRSTTSMSRKTPIFLLAARRTWRTMMLLPIFGKIPFDNATKASSTAHHQTPSLNRRSPRCSGHSRRLSVAGRRRRTPSPGCPSADGDLRRPTRRRVPRSAAHQVPRSGWRVVQKAHGLGRARRAPALGVFYDPTNALARGLMGMVLVPGIVASRGPGPAVHDDPERQAVDRGLFDPPRQTASKADTQLRLAAWCDRNGLGAGRSPATTTRWSGSTCPARSRWRRWDTRTRGQVGEARGGRG